jgi:hypothetical protein
MGGKRLPTIYGTLTDSHHYILWKMINKNRVEARTLPILQSLWRARHRGALAARDLISLLDPSNAATMLGAPIEQIPTLSGRAGNGFRTAGMLDRTAGRILISEEFKPEEMRFTAAHEVGHLVLHPGQSLFRDRPIPRLAQYLRRPEIEAEADHFAACLLMPRNLAYQQFERTFGISGSYVFDDAWAFWLCPSDPESLLAGEGCVSSRALALASARYFNGRSIHPLHQQFRVTVSAMAFRLMELGLTGKPEQVDSSTAAISDRRIPAPLFDAGLHAIEEGEIDAIFSSPFVHSSRRLQLVESLKRFLQFVRGIGVSCDIWIDGSFSTDKLEPDDIDIVVFIFPGQINSLSADRYKDLSLLNDRALMKAQYSCDVYVERASDDERRTYFLRTFGTYGGIDKGVPVLKIVR